MSASPNRQYKDAIYDQLARISKAVSAPKRLELLDLLCQSPRTVEVLADLASLSVANTSQHLQVLRAARLVAAEKKGYHVEYQVADDEVCQFLHALRALARSRLAEVEHVTRQFLEGHGAMEALPSKELLRRVRAGEVTVIDVRPVEEYTVGHLPGAVSIPLTELKKRLSELPKSREVVAYCRGPYCVLAIEAVELLRKKGFAAHRLEDGVTEWRARGGHLEVGEAKR